MNFDLSEDEEMLKAVAERFVADRYDPDLRRSYLAGENGFSAENWTLLGELGLIAALFEEDDGGLGVGPVGQATLFEALGRGLVVEPLIENVAVAGQLFASLASDAQKADWLAGLITGEKRLTLAHREQGARHNSGWVESRAVEQGEGYRLTGAKSLVPAGAGVNAYIVSAQVEGADGISLFLVDVNAPGLSIRPWRLVDGSLAVALSLEGVPATHLGGSLAEVDAAQTRGALMHCAEALGIMERLHADTLEYLRTRKQFGTPIGSFQALQHRMVAQYAAIEQARALLNLAMMADPADHAGWARAIHGARAFIAEAGVMLGHEMIQMHGGMGVTDELIIGQGHKRLLLLSRWPEDALAALDRYAAA